MPVESACRHFLFKPLKDKKEEEEEETEEEKEEEKEEDEDDMDSTICMTSNHSGGLQLGCSATTVFGVPKNPRSLMSAFWINSFWRPHFFSLLSLGRPVLATSTSQTQIVSVSRVANFPEAIRPPGDI